MTLHLADEVRAIRTKLSFLSRILLWVWEFLYFINCIWRSLYDRVARTSNVQPSGFNDFDFASWYLKLFQFSFQRQTSWSLACGKNAEKYLFSAPVIRGVKTEWTLMFGYQLIFGRQKDFDRILVLTWKPIESKMHWSTIILLLLPLGK